VRTSGVAGDEKGGQGADVRWGDGHDPKLIRLLNLTDPN